MMAPFPRRLKRSPYLGQWLMLAGMLLAFAALIAYALYQDYQRVAAREQERLATQAQVVARNLEPQIFATRRAIEGILADLPTWRQGKDGQKAVNRHLSGISDTLTGVRTLLVIDAAGKVVACNREELVGLDVTHREYFQAPRRHHDPNTLYVSPPFKTVLGNYLISLSRVITGPNGEFAGVVNASVDPEYFKILLDSVRYTPDMWVYLAHGEGKMFLMAPQRDDLIDKDLDQAGSFFSRHRASGQAASSFSGIAYVTGENRMMALRTIQPRGMAMDKALVVAVSRDLPAVFAPWYRDAYTQGGQFAVLALAAALGLYSYQRRQRALDRLVAIHDAEQKAMLDNEALLRGIIQAVDEGVLLLDGQGVVVFANPAAAVLLATKTEDLLGTHCPQLIQPMTGEAAEECPLCTARKFRLPFYSRELEFRRGDGGSVPVSIRATPTHGEGGGLVLAFYDISAEKAAADRLVASERKLHVLIDATPGSAMLLDLEGHIETINDVGARRLGHSPETIVGSDYFALLPDELAGRRLAVFAGVCAGGEPASLVDRRGGSIFQTDMFPAADAKGEIRQVALYTQDVTESRRAEAVQSLFHELGSLLLRREISLDTLVWHFCRGMAANFDFAFIWIGRKEADGRIAVVAGVEAAAGYLARLDECCLRWDEACSDPVCLVSRQGRVQVAEIGPAETQGWQALALAHGARHVVCLPLTIEGRTYGFMNLGLKDTLAPDKAALDRLEAIGSRLSLAMTAAIQQERLKLMETALESSGNAVFITDATGAILWANSAFERLTGYAPQEVLGRNPSLLNSGAHEAAFYTAIWQTILAGEIWRGEVIEAHRDGSRYTVHQTITPLRDPEGRIGHFVSILEDISAQTAAQERIAYLANYDALTDLPNRRLFFDRLGQTLALAQRGGQAVALLFLDLDRFKDVNDRCGHEVGDQLLKEVALRLRGLVRESDTVARLAGDEFTVILAGVGGREDCAQIAAKIVAAVGQPYALAGSAIGIGASIGIALFPDHAGDGEGLVRAADQAMYAAKAAGRGVFCFCADPARSD